VKPVPLYIWVIVVWCIHALNVLTVDWQLMSVLKVVRVLGGGGGGQNGVLKEFVVKP
jgi:hypothetical protein